jgi:hypothetical protein
LYEFVKSFDKDFSSSPEVNEKMIYEDGTPKVFYHGTNGDFTSFSYGEIGNATGVGILGDGFYFTDKKTLAKNYGKNVMPCYLKLSNPYIASASDAYKLNTGKLSAQGYDGVILKAPNGTVYMVFDNTQIKSAVDNIGTFDSNNPDIQYSDREDNVTEREILADTLMGAAANDIEKNKLKAYKAKVKEMEAEQEKLGKIKAQIKAQIKELSFAKGKRDAEKIKRLRELAVKTENRINNYDRQLLLKCSYSIKYFTKLLDYSSI